MRIVLASMGVEEFALLRRACEQTGHLPVAYAYSRSMRPRRSADPYAVRVISEVTEALPVTMDLLLPADTAGLGRALVGYRSDLLVIYGFNWILPPAVLEIPRFGAINIHPSLLPRYRGPAPVLRAIRNGDPEIGVTVHRIDAGVDTGPILAQRGGVPVDDDITAERLRAQLAQVIPDLLTTALARIAAGESGSQQPDTDEPRAAMMEPEYSRVDWSRAAREIHNQVRVFRFMGSRDKPVAQVGDQWLRLVHTSLQPTDGQRVECADGPLWIVESAPAVSPAIAHTD